MRRHALDFGRAVLAALFALGCDGTDEPAPPAQPATAATLSTPAGLEQVAPDQPTPEAGAPAASTAAPATASGQGAPSTPTTTAPSLPVVAPERAPVREGWEVPGGPDGRPLPLEVRVAKAHEALEAMRAERRRVFALGAQGSDEAVQALVAKLRGQVPAYERLEAIVALGPIRREAAVAPLVEALADPDLRVRAEAAITLYKWGERAQALPRLKELARLGAQVARAFHVDYQGTRSIWGPGARDFLLSALASPVPEVRIDAAVGLLEHPHDGRTAADVGEAVRVLEVHAIQAERFDERRYAVTRMASVRELPAVRTLLARASRDAHPDVAKTARQILAGEVTR